MEALASRVFWRLVAAFLIVVVASSGVMAHVVAMMTDHGTPPSIAALALGAGGAAMILGRLLAGYVLDYVFAPYVALLFFAMPLCGVGILLSAPTVSHCMLATVLVGAGLGAEIDLIAYMQSRYFGLRHFGQVYSYFLALFLIGSGLGPYLMGAVYAHFGGYGPALVAIAIGLGFACASMLTFAPYRYGPGLGSHPSACAAR